MASLCREFGISRRSGYKIFERYEQGGLEGLSDRTRRRFRYPIQLPEQLELAIVRAKGEKPHWGACKIGERLLRACRTAKIPAAVAIHSVLDRHGLVKPIRRRNRAERTPLSDGLHPNDLWCSDYKNEFQLNDKRLLLALPTAMRSDEVEPGRARLSRLFERLFQERSLPRAIPSDMVCPSPPLMDCFCSRHGFSLLAGVKASASTLLPYPGGEELVSSVGHPTQCYPYCPRLVMDSAIKTCYDARAYIVNTIAALEMILNAGLVTSDQERKLLEMAHRNANAALKTVDLLFESLCATPAPANT